MVFLQIAQIMSPNGNEVNSPMCLIPSNEIITQEQLSVLSRIAVASIGSQGTVGGLVVAGLVSYFIFESVMTLIIILSFSYLKPLVGEFLLALVLFMVAFTYMNVYLGLTQLSKEHSKANMCDMQLES